MIASIEGQVQSVSEDSLVVVIGGIGLRVMVTRALLSQARLSEDIFLHTHLVVREDSLTLYGFETQEEVVFFNLLLGVNGVGPRIAMNVISALTVDAIRRAVLAEQAEVFARVTGVGKKNAQKILLHLQGRVGGELPVGVLPSLDVDTEVMDALTALGYSIVEAQAALQSIPRETPLEVEVRLRAALKYFS